MRIWRGATTSTFTYGADLARYRLTTPQGTTILYLDKFMEIESGAATRFASIARAVLKSGGYADIKKRF